jgi:hypothetical protein
MRLGYHSITWGGVVGDPVRVTSVKDPWYLANAWRVAEHIADRGRGERQPG